MRKQAQAAWSWRSSLPWRRHPHVARAGAADFEAVRRAMHGLLQDAAAGGPAPLARALRLASDVRGLWHLRPALMQAVAAQLGESEARGRIAAIDLLVRQSWPDAPVSRPTPLA
jgi:hypothetical protein